MSDSKYLPDPDDEISEAGELDHEPVRAKNRQQAEDRCQEAAKEWGKDLVGIEPKGNGFWDCIFGRNR
jgi:hypothetical protein